GSKEEAKRYRRKAIRFDQESSKKLKSSEEVIKEAKYTDEILKEKIKEMMKLIPIEEVYVESLQVKHPIIDWKVCKEGQRSYWKIIRLGGSSACYQFFVDLLKHLDRLYEPDSEVQLWTQTQNFMHASIEWKLYDLSGVHQVTAKDKEILMLVEKDYPLRKGLALVMICYKLQVENFSQMANDLVLKIYKIANSPRQQEGTSHCLKKNATARRKLVPLLEDCTDVIVKKKLSVKDDSFLKISALCPSLYSSSNRILGDNHYSSSKLHQPWRAFAAIINKCLTGKSSGYDSLWLSQAQILWGLYHKRNVDFAYLMWADFVYQVEHKDTKKSNETYYPRFTKTDEEGEDDEVKDSDGDDDDNEVQQLKLVTKRSLKQTHISQASGSGADEGISSILGVPNVPTDESKEELSWN
nr:hypothetical protein [Tanacetum cinerariifolium]